MIVLNARVILQEKKLGWCNLQIAPPYLKLLYGKVICKKKKIWAVQFTNCTALSDATLCQSHLQEKKIWAVQFVNCTALSEATLWQSHLQEKKNLVGAIYKLHRPI